MLTVRAESFASIRVSDHVSLLEETSETWAIAFKPTIQATELLRYKEVLVCMQCNLFASFLPAECLLEIAASQNKRIFAIRSLQIDSPMSKTAKRLKDC
jgi:hypothetical protein